MSEVKRIIALVVIPGDTSQYVRNESYLLRSRSLRASPGEALEVSKVARIHSQRESFAHEKALGSLAEGS